MLQTSPAQPEPSCPIDSWEHRRDEAALVVSHKGHVQGVPHLVGLCQPQRVITRNTRVVLPSGDVVEMPRSQASQHQRTCGQNLQDMECLCGHRRSCSKDGHPRGETCGQPLERITAQSTNFANEWVTMSPVDYLYIMYEYLSFYVFIM